MKLKVIGSESLGNGYLITDGNETLIIECGVKLIEVKKVLDFDLSSISGCILSHYHGDHMGFVDQYLAAGIKVFTSQETIDNFKFKTLLRPTPCKAKKKFKVGNFTVLPFETEHDAAGSFGYVINHEKTGSILFLTDSFYSKFKFPNITTWIVEANYSNEILDNKVASGSLHYTQANRVASSHMSIDTCMELLDANDLSKTKNIVLIHLSSSNSDSRKFKEEVIRATGINTVVADRGIELNLNLKGF